MRYPANKISGLEVMKLEFIFELKIQSAMIGCFKVGVMQNIKYKLVYSVWIPELLVQYFILHIWTKRAKETVKIQIRSLLKRAN